MENKYKISIIVPVYNCEAMVGKCIESICTQTYKNFELILINDGSTDASGNICEEYSQKDARIKVIHKENGGQGTARNMGLDIADGDYIAFVDADDTVTPDMLEVSLKYISKSNADLCIFSFILDDGLRFQKVIPYAEPVVFANYDLMEEYVSTNKIFMGPCNKLYAKKLFDGVRFPALRAREDAYIMHILLGNAKKAVCIPECLYIQFIRPDSTETAKFSKKMLASISCADSLMTYYRKNYPSLYSYVAYWKADSILDVLTQILTSYSLKKYRVLYSELFERMRDEYRSVATNYKRNISTDATRAAIEHPQIFKWRVYLSAINRNLRRMVKKLLLFWRKK